MKYTQIVSIYNQYKIINEISYILFFILVSKPAVYFTLTMHLKLRQATCSSWTAQFYTPKNPFGMKGEKNKIFVHGGKSINPANKWDFRIYHLVNQLG